MTMVEYLVLQPVYCTLLTLTTIGSGKLICKGLSQPLQVQVLIQLLGQMELERQQLSTHLGT
jgi:hypothetical protein